jgi:hypothetical protein
MGVGIGPARVGEVGVGVEDWTVFFQVDTIIYSSAVQPTSAKMTS